MGVRRARPGYNSKWFKDVTPLFCGSSILTGSGIAGSQDDIFVIGRRMVHKHRRNWFAF